MRRSARDLPEMRGEPEYVAFFELMNSHLPRNFARVMRRLPSDPRCRLRRAPFGGIGGRMIRQERARTGARARLRQPVGEPDLAGRDGAQPFVLVAGWRQAEGSVPVPAP